MKNLPVNITNHKSMKRLLSILLAATAIAFAGYSQQDTNVQSYTTIPNFLGDSWNFLVGEGLTNLTITGVGTYTPALKKWGGGVVLTRNIPIGEGVATGIGLGVDYYDRNFYALNGQVSLQARIRPFATWGSSESNFWRQVEFTPHTFIALGTPFGGGGQETGNIETIEAGGAALKLLTFKGGRLSLEGLYGTRQGLGEASGTFYGGGLNLRFDW